MTNVFTLNNMKLRYILRILTLSFQIMKTSTVISLLLAGIILILSALFLTGWLNGAMFIHDNIPSGSRNMTMHETPTNKTTGMIQ